MSGQPSSPRADCTISLDLLCTSGAFSVSRPHGAAHPSDGRSPLLSRELTVPEPFPIDLLSAPMPVPHPSGLLLAVSAASSRFEPAASAASESFEWSPAWSYSDDPASTLPVQESASRPPLVPPHWATSVPGPNPGFTPHPPASPQLPADGPETLVYDWLPEPSTATDGFDPLPAFEPAATPSPAPVCGPLPPPIIAAPSSDSGLNRFERVALNSNMVACQSDRESTAPLLAGLPHYSLSHDLLVHHFPEHKRRTGSKVRPSLDIFVLIATFTFHFRAALGFNNSSNSAKDEAGKRKRRLQRASTCVLELPILLPLGPTFTPHVVRAVIQAAPGKSRSLWTADPDLAPNSPLPTAVTLAGRGAYAVWLVDLPPGARADVQLGTTLASRCIALRQGPSPSAEYTSVPLELVPAAAAPAQSAHQSRSSAKRVKRA